MKAAPALGFLLAFVAAGAAAAQSSPTGFGRKMGPAGFQAPASPVKPSGPLAGAYRPAAAPPAPAAAPRSATAPLTAADTFKPYGGVSTYGAPKPAEKKAKRPPGYTSTY